MHGLEITHQLTSRSWSPPVVARLLSSSSLPLPPPLPLSSLIWPRIEAVSTRARDCRGKGRCLKAREIQLGSFNFLLVAVAALQIPSKYIGQTLNTPTQNLFRKTSVTPIITSHSFIFKYETNKMWLCLPSLCRLQPDLTVHLWFHEHLTYLRDIWCTLISWLRRGLNPYAYAF